MEQSSIEGIDMDSSGPPALHIPTEVCENIIDMLYSISTPDTLEHITTLHSCALVCRAWRVRSQRMLFYLVQLSTSTSLNRLSAILDAARHLRDYVYFVELAGYHLHNTTSIFALFPVIFAGKLPNLCQVDVVQLDEGHEARFPRTPDPPKSRSLPYIPLHPRFPFFLSSFTALSCLYFLHTTFRSFSEFARMLHGLPNLEQLICDSVRWITPGGAHPGADLMKPPDWAAGRSVLPPFAPKIRSLLLPHMSMYGVERLIWTRGPHLTQLGLTIPPSVDPEDIAPGQTIDLSACTGLETLVLIITPQFSMDGHVGFVKELLASWKPQCSESQLQLSASDEKDFTRRGFADVLRSIGTITEKWIQPVTEPPLVGNFRSDDGVRCRVHVAIYDWDAEKQWWQDHLASCFPTWLRLGRLSWDFLTPQWKEYEWANEEQSPQTGSLTVASRDEDLASSSRSKSQDTLSPEMAEHA